MSDNAKTLDRIERALEANPFCPVCRAPTVIRDHDGRLWLECSTTPDHAPTGVLAQIGAAVAPHPRRLVADLLVGHLKDPIAT
jgi:ribosomal protein L37AE/L43A